MKKTIGLCLAAVLALSAVLAGCGKEQQSGAEPVEPTTNQTTDQTEVTPPAVDEAVGGNDAFTIGLVATDLTDPFFASIQEGAVNYCEAAGHDLTVLDGSSDSETMIAANENLIAAGADIICTHVMDAVALESVVKEAVEQGIVVSAMPTYVNGTMIAVIYDDYSFGYMLGVNAGEWINEHFGGEAEYAVLSMPTNESLIKRGEGIQDGIASVASNAKMAVDVAAYTQDAGVDAAETILQQYPDLKVICSATDAAALGAMQGIMGLGKATDDFFLGGLNGSDAEIEAIRDESTPYRATVATTIPVQELSMWYIQNAVRAAQGERYAVEAGPTFFAVTIDNIEEFVNRAPDYTKTYEEIDMDVKKWSGK